MINYFNRTDDQKFEEVRLWIALIFDDFKAYDRPKIEIEHACETVYDDLGGHQFYHKATNEEKCQALNYYLNRNRKKEKIESGKY